MNHSLKFVSIILVLGLLVGCSSGSNGSDGGNSFTTLHQSVGPSTNKNKTWRQYCDLVESFCIDVPANPGTDTLQNFKEEGIPVDPPFGPSAMYTATLYLGTDHGRVALCGPNQSCDPNQPQFDMVSIYSDTLDNNQTINEAMARDCNRKDDIKTIDGHAGQYWECTGPDKATLISWQFLFQYGGKLYRIQANTLGPLEFGVRRFITSFRFIKGV